MVTGESSNTAIFVDDTDKGAIHENQAILGILRHSIGPKDPGLVRRLAIARIHAGIVPRDATHERNDSMPVYFSDREIKDICDVQVFGFVHE